MRSGGEPTKDRGGRRPPSRAPVVEASFLWRRFLACLLDLTLLLPIGALALVRLWTLLDVATMAELRAARKDVTAVLVVTWLAMLTVMTYNRWWRQGMTGQSWGKRIMRLRLVSIVGGQPIGPRAAFLRDIFNGFIAFGPALALVHPRGQTLGDVAVGAVVREEQASRQS